MPEIRQIRVGGVTYDVVASEDEVSASRAQRYAEQAKSSALSANDARLTTSAYVNNARNYALAASDSADRAEQIVGGQFLSYGGNQGLSDTQKEQARVNIGKAENYVLSDKKTVIKLSNYSTNPLQGFKVEIVPRQLGSGTPTPANIRPIKGWNSVKLNHTTKNLFTIPNEVFEDRGLLSAGGTSLYGTGPVFASNAGSSNYIPLPYPITSQCTLSATVSCTDGTTAGSGLSMGFIYYPGTAGTSVTWLPTDFLVRRKVTSTLGSVVIGIYFSGGSNPTQSQWRVSKIQLELGTTNTDYEEITSELIGNFSTPVYMGNANTNTQLLTVTHDVLVITGEENWQINPNYENTVYLSQSALPVTYTNVETNLCDRLEWSETVSGDSTFTLGNNINIKDSTIARDVATFKSYAQAQYANGTPITFVLRRPTTYSYALPDIPVSKFTNYSYVWSNVSATSNADSIQLLYMKSGVLTEEYDLYLDTKIPTIISGQTSNRNLLDNPWWGSGEVVNQRSVTAKPSNGAYCIDRWTWNSGSDANNMSLGANGITFTRSASSIWFAQKLANPSALVGKKITGSVMLSDGTIKSGSVIYASVDSTPTLYQDSAVQIYISSVGAFSLTIKTTQTIRAVKLELGSYSTLANDVPPDYGTELAKCQRYFYRMSNATYLTPCAVLAENGTNAYGIMHLPVPMRAQPTLSYSGSFICWLGSNATTIEVTAISINNPAYPSVNPAVVSLRAQTAGGLTVGTRYDLQSRGNASAYIDLSADL